MCAASVLQRFRVTRRRRRESSTFLIFWGRVNVPSCRRFFICFTRLITGTKLQCCFSGRWHGRTAGSSEQQFFQRTLLSIPAAIKVLNWPPSPTASSSEILFRISSKASIAVVMFGSYQEQPYWCCLLITGHSMMGNDIYVTCWAWVRPEAKRNQVYHINKLMYLMKVLSWSFMGDFFYDRPNIRPKLRLPLRGSF